MPIKLGSTTVIPKGFKAVYWGTKLVYGGSVEPWETVTGSFPITLLNAVQSPIRLLTQYGKCAQNGTPTPSTPVDIVCNNGTLKYGIPSTLSATRINAYITTDGIWKSSSDSYSIAVPVTVGKSYSVIMTNTDSATVGTILRFGFSTVSTPQSNTLTQVVRTSPQSTPFTEVVADRPYLVIQMGAAVFANVITNGYIVVQENVLYIDGTPEVLTVSATGATTQTATVENLFAVGNYKDEQNLITGVVTRRTAVCVYDGTQTIGDVYLSTTGGKDIGAIIVYPLAEEYTENVTPQALYTSDGTNVVDATANVSGITATVEYLTGSGDDPSSDLVDVGEVDYMTLQE